MTTLLALLTGRDRPGLTADLFDSLAGRVVDVEQVVIGGQLTLTVIIEIDDDAVRAVADHIATVADRFGLGHRMQVGADPALEHRAPRHRVTVLAEPLNPHEFAAVSKAVYSAGGNIDRITRVADYPVTAVELQISGADTDALRRALAITAAASALDVAVQPVTLDSHGQRLIVMDVDSTLIQDEVIELIADFAGCAPEVAAVTEAAMAGRLDFAESLRHRVALLAGVAVSDLDLVRERVRLTPGARTLCRTLHRLGYRIALVSGGFAEIVEPLAAELDVDYVRANRLEVADGRLTGRLSGPIVDRAGKAAALREFAADAGVPLSRTIAIGDGANDLDMLAASGLGIAFNAKPVVRQEADAALNVPYLDAVLFILGITREQVEAADAAAG